MTPKQSNNSRPESDAPENSSLSPLERAAAELNKHFGISGPTDAETEESDGLEYRVTFPPNRGFAQQESSEPGLPSEDPMLPAHNGLET